MKIRSKESQSKRYAVNRYVSADYVFSMRKCTRQINLVFAICHLVYKTHNCRPPKIEGSHPLSRQGMNKINLTSSQLLVDNTKTYLMILTHLTRTRFVIHSADVIDSWTRLGWKKLWHGRSYGSIPLLPWHQNTNEHLRRVSPLRLGKLAWRHQL